MQPRLENLDIQTLIKSRLLVTHVGKSLGDHFFWFGFGSGLLTRRVESCLKKPCWGSQQVGWLFRSARKRKYHGFLRPKMRGASSMGGRDIGKWWGCPASLSRRVSSYESLHTTWALAGQICTSHMMMIYLIALSAVFSFSETTLTIDR